MALFPNFVTTMHRARPTLAALGAACALLLLSSGRSAAAQPGFSWVNPSCRSTPTTPRVLELVGVSEEPTVGYPRTLHHATFMSPSMQVEVGYCVYLPPEYEDPANIDRLYPVVYHLHGGRPGNESRSARLAGPVDRAIRDDMVGPAIYVFPNGGLVSHYNSTQHDSYGERVFIDELIPHIDRTYRTLPGRRGRALQGFSQGGRGTARIVFRHPELSCSVPPRPVARATPRNAPSRTPAESTTPRQRSASTAVRCASLPETMPGTSRHGRWRPRPRSHRSCWIGTNGFNYEGNLDYMRRRVELGIPFERLVVPDAGHHPGVIYRSHGIDIMTFHEQACEWPRGSARPEPFGRSSSVGETLSRHADLLDPDHEIWWRRTGPTMAWRNRHVHQIAPTASIYRGGPVGALAARPMPEIAGFELSLDDQPIRFEDLLQSERSTTMGLVMFSAISC